MGKLLVPTASVWQGKWYYCNKAIHIQFFSPRLGEGCSHVAAIMFKVEAAVRNGYTVGTSSLCRWNQIFTKKVTFSCCNILPYDNDFVAWTSTCC